MTEPHPARATSGRRLRAVVVLVLVIMRANLALLAFAVTFILAVLAIFTTPGLLTLAMFALGVALWVLIETNPSRPHDGR